MNAKEQWLNVPGASSQGVTTYLFFDYSTGTHVLTLRWHLCAGTSPKLLVCGA